MILNHLLKHMANPRVASEECFKTPLKSNGGGDKETLCAFRALNLDQAILGADEHLSRSPECIPALGDSQVFQSMCLFEVRGKRGKGCSTGSILRNYTPLGLKLGDPCIDLLHKFSHFSS